MEKYCGYIFVFFF